MDWLIAPFSFLFLRKLRGQRALGVIDEDL